MQALRWGARASLHTRLPLVLSLVAAVVISGVALGDVMWTYPGTSTVSGNVAPFFVFANGVNYAQAQLDGVQTNLYPLGPADVSVTETGYLGSSGTYALDVLAIQNPAATTVTWTLSLTVSVAIVGSNLNALWFSYCTAAPTNVPASGTPLQSGTDGSGNPYAIFAPNCPAGSVQGNLNMMAVTVGATPAVVVPAGTPAGTTDVYISFLLAVGSSGVATSTPAQVTLAAEA